MKGISPTAGQGASGRHRAVGGALLLLALTLSAYWPAIRGGFIWDDDDYVEHNATLRSADGLRQMWLEPLSIPQYYPLVHSTFWVEYRLWGLNPMGYHVTNVLLQFADAVLPFLLLALLAIPGAPLAAAIFALHPIHVESVAWITERKNVLAGFFYLASALAFAKYKRLDLDDAPEAGPRRLYYASLALFLAALLSKTVACSLPVTLGLLVWWKRGRLDRRSAVELLPFLALGLPLGLFTAWVEKHHVNAVGAAWEISPIGECLVAGRVLWFYLGKLLWPDPLVFMYPRWVIDTGAGRQYLFPAAALAGLGALWAARGRIGRGPLAAALQYAAALFPALGFISVAPMRFSFVADHFQYLASLGPIVLAGAALSRGLRRAPALAPPAGAALVHVLAALTWRQAHDYADIETLWKHTIAKNPACWMAHDNLANLYVERGRADEAIPHYREAVRLHPVCAEAHNNLEAVYLKAGRLPEVEAEFSAVLRLRPDVAGTHNNLGVILFRQGKLGLAKAHFEAAVQLMPDLADARDNLREVEARLRARPQR